MNIPADGLANAIVQMAEVIARENSSGPCPPRVDRISEPISRIVIARDVKTGTLQVTFSVKKHFILTQEDPQPIP